MNNTQNPPALAVQPASRFGGWPALVMGSLLLASALSLGLVSMLLAVLGWHSLTTMRSDESLFMFTLVVGTLALSLLSLPGVYLNVCKFFNWPQPRLDLHRLPARWLILGLFIAWAASLLLGSLLAAYPKWTLPGLPFVSTAALIFPMCLVLVICLRGLPMPSPRRAWSIFGANLVLAPSLVSFFEIFAFMGFGLLFLLYVSSTPGLDVIFRSLVEELKYESGSREFISQQAGALLLSPGARIFFLGLFALVVPIIEEVFKVGLLWFYAGRMRSQVEGFIAGVLCGAAFALVENISFVAGGGAEDWLLNLLSRTSAILPHIFNCGLAGWALVGAWQKPAQNGGTRRRGLLRLGLVYMVIILIHGAWNALSVAMVFTSLDGVATDLSSLLETSAPIIAAWGVLASGLFLGLFIANRQMRKQALNENARDVEYNLPSL